MTDPSLPRELTSLEKKIAGDIGQIDFSNRSIASFSQIEIPVVTQILNLSDNNITSFEGFLPSPRLETLILDNNPLLSFLEFPLIHSLRHFSAKNSPLSELPNFIGLSILCFETGSFETFNGKTVDDLPPCRLETLNGRPVTVADRAAVSAKTLAQHFVNKATYGVHLSPTPEGLTSIVKPIGEALRRGWIADSFPRTVEQIERESQNMECDPVSVRIVRICGLLKNRGWEVPPLLPGAELRPRDPVQTGDIPRLFQKLLAPAPEKVERKIFVGDEWTARATRQQALIFQLHGELEELREAPSRQATVKAAAKKADAGKLSEETLVGYRALLARYGQPLIDNSAKVKGEAKAVKKKPNANGLRAAVAKLTGSQPETSDGELAALLRELGQNVPGKE